MGTLAQFVQQLEDCEIVDPRQLKIVLAAGESLRTAGDLARELVKQKQLTQFQAQRVYEGKAKSLVLGNYTILDKIGAGGMGQVYKARHRRMERIVAVKMLPPDVARNDAAQARFQREVVAAAKLGHPNIVAAYDADLVGDAPFLVMEFVDGVDLAALVRRAGPLPLHKAIGCVLQTARGLDYAHKQGIVHRDIKPANLLVDKAGRVKILDMGLARMDSPSQAMVETQAELTGAGVIVGTVDYMAPEQAIGSKVVDPRSDIYSLGCTLYFLLSGKALYDGDSVIGKLLAHREKPIPSLSDVQPHVPPAIDDVFRRMVAKNPADRFQTLGELIPALQSFAKTFSNKSEPPPVVDPQQAAAAGAGDDCVLDGIISGSGLGFSRIGSGIGSGSSPSSKGRLSKSGIGKKGVGDSGSNPAVDSASGAEGMLDKLTGSWPRRKIGIVAAAIGAPLLVGVAIVIYALSSSRGNADTKPGSLSGDAAALTAGSGDAASGTPRQTDYDRQAAERVRKHHTFALQIAAGANPPQQIGADSVLPQSRFKVLEATISGEPISEADLASLVALTDLGALRLEHVNLTSAMLSGLPRMRKLTTLSVAGNPGVGDDAVKSIGRETKLRSLDVSGTRLTDAGLQELSQLLPGLEHLAVQDTGVTAAGGATFKRELPTCSLDGAPSAVDTATTVTPVQPQPTADADHAAAAWLSTLKDAKLSISEAGGAPRPSPHGDPLPQTPFKIVEIELADSAPLAELSHLAGLTELQKLSIERCDVTDAAIATLPPLAKLENLDLAGNQHITDAALKLVGNRAGLRSLDLSNTGITVAGIQQIKRLANLESLSLGGLADFNGKLFPQFAGLTKLRKLELAGTPIGDVDVQQLNLPQIKSFNFSQCKLTDAGLKRLADVMPKLEWIDLSGTTVTATGIAAFEKAEPRCIIQWTPPTQ